MEVDDIPVEDGPWALEPPDQPDIIAGTTVIVVFYAGTMQVSIQPKIKYEMHYYAPRWTWHEVV